MQPVPPPAEAIIRQVRQVLEEDVGTGDLTAHLIPGDLRCHARIVSREAMVLCGRPWADEVFRQLSAAVVIDWHAGEGDRVGAGDPVCTIEGPARAMLTGERTALNYLQCLSGTATLARQYADAVAGTGVRILDTRKTVPGLRLEQKYAVRCGGCHNHRMGLFDAVLIKENHIAAAGSIAEALRQAAQLASGVDIEIEVESLAQLQEALDAKAQHILLDNFALDELHAAVRMNAGQARLEASGGVSLDTVRNFAETGVNDISVGSLTKDIKAIDLSMRFM